MGKKLMNYDFVGTLITATIDQVISSVGYLESLVCCLRWDVVMEVNKDFSINLA